jgi:hypothetical protein
VLLRYFVIKKNTRDISLMSPLYWIKRTAQDLEEAIEADEISEEDAEREREAIEALDVEDLEAK